MRGSESARPRVKQAWLGLIASSLGHSGPRKDCGYDHRAIEPVVTGDGAILRLPHQLCGQVGITGVL